MKVDFGNLPPFYVGQRVICIVGSELTSEDETYIVTGIYRGVCKCAKWVISVGIEETAPGTLMNCGRCNKKLVRREQCVHPAQHFVPETNSFESISFEKVVEIESPLVSVN